MKLSLLTFSIIPDGMSKQVDAETLCRICGENAIPRIDLMDRELELYGAAELKAAMEKNGIACGSLITSIDFLDHPDDADGALRTALENCRHMGTDTLMIVPGWGKGSREPLPERSRNEMMEKAVRFFRGAVAEAELFGLTVGLEDTPQADKPFCTISEMRELMTRVPGLRLILDTGNILVGDPQADLLAYYQELKQYITRIHLKDVVKGNHAGTEVCVDGEKIAPVVTGSGILPMREFLGCLKEDGYDGDLCIEYAAPKDVHGLDHAKAVAPYTDYIRDVWEGQHVQSPCMTIHGVSKPVSRIFFGTAIMPMLSGQDCDALLDSIYAYGVNAFDCARGYGLAEQSLGNWIRRRNNRERIVLLTKCGNSHPDGSVLVNRKVIEEELAQSLEALQTDYIDIFLLHRDDPNTPVGEFIECLNEQQQARKIRVFGVSNWTRERIEEANAWAAAHGLNGFTVSSPNYGLADQVRDPWGGNCVTVSGDRNRDVREWYAQNRMPVLAYSSLGRGFFSGKFRSGDYEAAKKVLDPYAQAGFLYPVNMDRLARCEALAEEKGCEVPEIAIRYIFGSEMAVCAVVSTTNPRRMKQNVRAALNPLTQEEIAFLETGVRA